MLHGIAIGIGIVIGLAVAPTLIRWVVWLASLCVLLVVGLGVLVSPFLIMVDLGLPVTRDAGFQVYCMLLLAIGLAIHTLEKTAFGQRCQQLARSIKLTDDTTGSLRLLPLGAIAVVGSILGVLLVWTLG